MRARRRALPGGLAVLASALACLVGFPASEARAYVRTSTGAGAPMYWNRTIFELTAYVGSPPSALAEGDLLRAATAAAATWSRSQVGCTSIELRVVSRPEPDAPVGLDGQSRITFRRSEWCRVPREMGEPCYDPFALAVTSVFARRNDGEILDADIELNGQFTWGDLVRGTASAEVAQDLQNTLTHEMGHYIGLDHTCTLASDDAGLVDDQGNQVPACARASQAIKDTTMFAAVIPGDIDRRSLAPDDLKAVCAVYPSLDPVLQADAAGCALGGRPAAPASLLILSALLALSAARLRRRAGPPAPASRSSTGPAPPR
jgi:hypothetical protein